LSCGAGLTTSSDVVRANDMRDQQSKISTVQEFGTMKIDWFKGGILAAFSVIAFSVFYHYVISLPKIEQTAKQVVGTPETMPKVLEPPKEQAISFAEQRDKAARDLTQAQEEFERQVRDDNARAQARLNQDQQARDAHNKEMRVRGALSQCLRQAHDNYLNHWNHTCAVQGRPQGCTLLGPVVANLDQNHRAARDECFKVYPPDTVYAR